VAQGIGVQAEAYGMIKELDINPLRVFHEGEGCTALDARTILWNLPPIDA